MQRKTSIKLASLAILSALAAPLIASEGFYAGVSVGQAKSDIDKKSFKHVNPDGKAKVNIDKESSAWKAFVGYQFTPYFGAEAFYADLGKSEASSVIKKDDKSIKNSGSIDATALGMAGTLSWPVNEDFSVFGKGGLVYWNASYDVKPKNVVKMSDKKDFGTMFGLGAKYSLNDQFSVVAEWERYMKVGKGDFKGTDIDLLSVGLVYSF